MPIKIIRPRETRERVEFRLEFPWLAEPGACVSLPCDERGEPRDAAGVARAAGLRADPGYGAPVVSRAVARWTQPALAICDCGARIELWGDTDCDRCGATYNGSGQRLVPAHLWEEPWDGE